MFMRGIKVREKLEHGGGMDFTALVKRFHNLKSIREARHE
ncbi:hypothetical protein B8V81_1723 [Paenibacillus pasadenensis]|uniref:Uncharacterized protein n=1 Tax=Paenibacillus pasadenensis TaxID=217090 RepID=A0A2N5NAW9_9BACL|nr:hypothetical protein B8V81_1723 [Paenibacillus pasadenensis]